MDKVQKPNNSKYNFVYTVSDVTILLKFVACNYFNFKFKFSFIISQWIFTLAIPQSPRETCLENVSVGNISRKIFKFSQDA